MSRDIRNIKGMEVRRGVAWSRLCPRSTRGTRGLVLAAKRDAVIRRYWQFSRSITGTRKRENTPVEIYRGCREPRGWGKNGP